MDPPLVATTGALAPSTVPDVTIGWPSVPRRGLSLPHHARASETENHSIGNFKNLWLIRKKNKLAKLQATLVRNYDSPTHRGKV